MELFFNLLNNKSKERKTCLLACLEGRIDGEVVTDLQPMQEWCFNPDQTWNRCFTARYLADGRGAIVAPLFRQLIRDIVANVNFEKMAPEEESIGIIRKDDKQDWVSLESSLLGFDTSPGMPDPELIRTFASTVNTILGTGQRLVLFCEVQGEPSLETLGLDEQTVGLLLEMLPERFALILAGIREPVTKDSRIARIEIDPDYLTTSPPDDRSQPLASDTALGTDALNVQGEVNALADAIAGKDMEPPLVLGILGGWGAGKSFVLHLLEERLLAIRRKNILNPKVRASYPYVGHFYLVRFDAWTYAKADLWSSLMQEVLLALNDQIAYEQLSVDRGASNPKDLKKIKSIERLLGDRDAFDEETAREYLEKLPPAEEGQSPEKLTEMYRKLKRRLFDERFAKLLTGDDEFTPDVVDKLTRDGANARETLERLDNDILWSRLQGLNERLQRELTKEEKGLRDAKQALAESEAQLEEDVEQELRNEHWKTFAATLSGNLAGHLRTSVDNARKAAGADKGIPFDEAIESVGLLQKTLAGMSIRTVAVFLAFVLAGIVVSAFTEQIAAMLVGLSGVLGGALAGVAESWSRANRWMKTQVEAFNAFDAKLKVKQQERRKALIAQAQAVPAHQNKVQTVAALESKVEAYRRRIGLTAGHPTLLDFITNRLKEGGYAERLGLLHQVQQDIRQLTEGLFSSTLCVHDGEIGQSTEIDKLLFPRGLPRVVLFIDDLDRCPPTRVVEVLEAAQLLVKTKLFVVVMAMDVRYITKALEKAYEGVLDRRGAPSGLDYIEKIVQVPYRIRPITAEAMPGYLRSQMQLRLIDVEIIEEEAKPSNGELLSIISAPGEGTVRIDETIPQKVLEFDDDEFELIKESALAVIIGPRATKRLVNVMKLIKIIWYRSGYDEVSPEIKKTVVFFLSLSANYAEIMRRVLLEMERVVASPDSRGFRQKLPLFLARTAKDWSSLEGRHTDWEFLTRAAKADALLPSAMTLEKLGSHNIELIRSFSFVGEVDLPPDPATHQVSLQIQEPVRISQHEPGGK